MRRVNGSGVRKACRPALRSDANRCALSRLRVAFRDPSNRLGALMNYMIRQFHRRRYNDLDFQLKDPERTRQKGYLTTRRHSSLPTA